jgi:hypothetical protein
MACLFRCGFEENDLTKTMWTGTTGNLPTIVTSGTSTPHSGTYSLETAAAAGNSYVTRSLSAAKTSGTLFTRTYVKCPTATPSANSIAFAWASSTPTIGPQVEWTTTGALKLTNIITGTNTTTTTILSANTIYRLELRQLISDAPGAGDGLELRLYLGDQTAVLETLTIYNEDTLPTNILTLRLGKTASTSKFYFDDVGVNDATGSTQNTWCGPGKIALAVAQNSVAVTWAAIGVANNWDAVDDEPGTPDDATTYNHDTGTLHDDQLTVPVLAADIPSNATMLVFDLYARVSAIDATTGTMALKIWDDLGAGTPGPTMTVNSATWRFTSTAEHQSFDLTGKTKATVQNFSMGYRSLSGTNDKAITALWANVEWIEVSSPPMFRGS